MGMVAFRHSLLLLACGALLVCAPLAYADTRAELEASIRAALLHDPNAALISPRDFEALVAALTVQMGRQHVAPERIATTTPEGLKLVQAQMQDFCAGVPEPFCSWANSHGINPGTLLWVLSLIFALVVLGILVWLWRLLHHHDLH